MRKVKLQTLLIALAVIMTTFLSQETLAYSTAAGVATNVVTSGSIRMKIHEEMADGTEFPEEGVYVEPGDVVSKRVTVENICTQPFYLRVKLVSGVERAGLSGEDAFDIDLNTADWTLHSDGYIYYNGILQPDETTAPVFTEVGIIGSDEYRGETLTLTVVAHAAQSKNNPAEHPWDAAGWPGETEGAV